MSEVVIYNPGGVEVVGRVTVRHAITMLHRKVARVYRAVEGETVGPYQRPQAVELVRYVYTRWVYDRTGKVPYSKAALLRRDRHRCAYCGGVATTMDHVIPKSRPGGTTTWLNAVAACEPCNFAKADRTPQEAGMRLRVQPFEPILADIYPSRRR